MDSITQATLGASVAHLIWQKPLGRKALFLGAVFGTLPDLDVLAYPFLDPIQRLYWHRGESHSILFIFLISLLLAYLFHRRWWRKKIEFKQIFYGFLAIFATHVLIDYFTIYGTQLLAPFSRYGFAHGNMFIIDPLYTLPLLFGIVFTIFYNNPKPNRIGLYISSCYALYSLLAHGYAHQVFARDLESKGIHVKQAITMATPFNTILWRHLAQTEDGLKVGYYSLLTQEEIEYEDIAQNKALVLPYKNSANVEVIEWFSKGFWVAKKDGDRIRMSDARFGEIRANKDAKSEDWSYLFSWLIASNENKMQRAPRVEHNLNESFSLLYERAFGLKK
jgi:inner membrane protein